MKKIFFLTIIAAGLLSACNQKTKTEQVEVTAVEATVVSRAAETVGRQEIQVLSAVVKDEKIEGAEVIFQRNGSQSIVGRTNAEGIVVLNTPFPDDLETTVIIKKEGYSTLVAKCPCEGLTYAISPNMKNLDAVRVVLVWGKYPEDLDSHLWYGREHVYFDQLESPNAQLDVDDTDSYGPETITIEEKIFGEEYIYAVHDYTNKEANHSTALSNSDAKVFVYIGQSLVKTYYVPKNRNGNLWTVFKVSAGGEIVDINSFVNQKYSEASALRYELSGITPIRSTVNTDTAAALNREGTKAYEAKDYDSAIRNYTAAIEQDPNFGQAYSNLGLAYQRAGMNAEALWANRKAIALASGNSASTTRASSYYNIARIYEEQKEYAKALEQYKMAKSEKENTVYDNAIKRMEDQLQSN